MRPRGDVPGPEGTPVFGEGGARLGTHSSVPRFKGNTVHIRVASRRFPDGRLGALTCQKSGMGTNQPAGFVGAGRPNACDEDVARFWDRVSGRHRQPDRHCDDHNLAPILGPAFETLEALISGLPGFVPKPTGFENRCLLPGLPERQNMTMGVRRRSGDQAAGRRASQ